MAKEYWDGNGEDRKSKYQLLILITFRSKNDKGL